MSHPESSIPASRRNAIFMTCDENYFPYTLFLASEISKGTPDRNFDICVIHDGDAPHHPLMDIHNIRLIPFDQSEHLAGIEVNRHLSIATFQRIFVPEMLREDYDRLFYLDTDILYRRGDINRLFEMDMRGHPVAAVLDTGQHRKLSRHMTEFKAARLPRKPYFNAGVMLIDVAAYIDQDIAQKAMGFARIDDPKLTVHNDQSALNLALYDNWLELSPVWNWPTFHHYISYRHFADPCLLHFMGKAKPWNDAMGLHAAQDVNAYRRFVAEHFPELLATFPVRKVHDGQSWKWPALLLREAKDYRRIRPYLMRFSDDDFEVK